MNAIIRKEFFELFRGIKSIIILALFMGASYLTAHFINNNPGLFNSGSQFLSSPSHANIAYLGGLRILLALFGCLFIMMLSHDVINREIESQTIRLQVTKTSRRAIVVGKFIGVFAFWFVVLLLSFLLVTVMSKHFFWVEFLQLLSFTSLPIGLCLFMSLVVKKPSLSVVIGLVFSLIFPIVGLWSNMSETFVLKYILRFLFPYFYLFHYNLLFLVPLLFSLLLVGLTVVLFERRDL